MTTKRRFTKAATADYHRRLLNIQILDHAKATGLAYPAALLDLARTKPHLFKYYEHQR